MFKGPSINDVALILAVFDPTASPLRLSLALKITPNSHFCDLPPSPLNVTSLDKTQNYYDLCKIFTVQNHEE